MVFRSDGETSEYVRIDTEHGAVSVLRASVPFIAGIDSIIFDVDGVLIDISQSIQFVHKEAARRYFGMLGWMHCDHMIEPEDVDAFKHAGGFNNDWDVAAAWLMLYLFKSAQHGSTDGEVLKASEPGIREFSSELARRGGCMDSAVNAIREMCRPEEWAVIQAKWDRPSLERMFQEVYSGDLCSEVYGFEPKVVCGPGLVRKDRPILDRKYLPSLKLGIATGRTGGETVVGMRLMGWDDVFTAETIVSEDDGFWKPDPQILDLAVRRLDAKRSMYIGDTPDDMRTVKRYNEDYGPMVSCMVRTGLQCPDGDGADMIASNVNAALLAVERLIGGASCPDEQQR